MSLRVAFFGTPAFSVPILEVIANQNSIAVVVSQPDKPAGKGQQMLPSAVSTYAREHHFPLLNPPKLSNDDFKQQVMAIDIDVVVVVAYGKILPQWLLDLPRLGAINIHASLLPQYRGASPIAASILNGDSQTGVSYIIMDSKMDEGDVIFQSKLDINNQETTVSLANKLSLKASQEINTVLQLYAESKLKPVPQDHSLATYCHMLTKQDGRIDLYNPPQNVERMIRAYHPWPGVWGLFKGKRIKLLPHGKVQMEGKRLTSIADFKLGHPDFPLEL